MKISTRTIAAIAKDANIQKSIVPDDIHELSQKIGAQLGAIETIEDFGAKYEGVVVARVISCIDHPNADRLHVCTIDDGGITPDVKRDSDGYVQVVCGAPNVRAGLLVAWLPPGSTVPDSIVSDPFVLGARELRGVMSNGMLASPKELAISDNHQGILEIDVDIAPGTSFVDAFDLRDDFVLDIENKMFTHRPDCFGWLGVAREVAGIQGKAFTSPEWYDETALEGTATTKEDTLPLVLTNEIPELVPRFIAITLQNITVGPSPLWLQLRLARHGVRPINNVVDITNFLMLETGQPLHAYDYDKVRAQDANAKRATIGARYPNQNETLALLNGKTVTPHETAIIISSVDRAIGLGGVMGGADTEVTENTTNIILECASFDMYAIRRTAMEHGIFTDAVTRFTKGQSPLQNGAVAKRAVTMLEALAGAQVVRVYDDNHVAHTTSSLKVDSAFVNARLGLSLTVSQMQILLTNVEFGVQIDNDTLVVTVPFWRTDIAIAEDIVEEIGRLYGYENLPHELPLRRMSPTIIDPALALKSRIRSVLSRAGAHEVLTYSFVHGKMLQKVGQDAEHAFSLANALSPELQYYRLSVLPSLLDRVHANSKAGHNEFGLFELGKAHVVGHLDSDKLPLEFSRVAFVYACADKVAKQKTGAAYYVARTYVDALLRSLGIDYDIVPMKDVATPKELLHSNTPFEPSRCAALRVNQAVIGFVGEFRTSVR